MSIIEEIKLYVKHGKLPIVQDKDKDYGIVTIVGDRIYGICNRWKQKREDLFIDYERIYYSEEEIKEDDWHIVGQYDIPTIPFKVGQKVKVREDLGGYVAELLLQQKQSVEVRQVKLTLRCLLTPARDSRRRTKLNFQP